MYISLNKDKDSNLLQDRPVLSTGRTHHNKTAIVLTTTKTWSWIPDGAQRQDGLRDRPSVVKWLWLLATSPWRRKQHGPLKR